MGDSSALKRRSALLQRGVLRCKQFPVFNDMVQDRVYSRALTAAVRRHVARS